MSVHDLLTAMLLPSADDAAVDLAYNVGHRSVSRFVAMMNARARQLGLTHTHYTTPSGLDTPGNYSSAGDLVDLARYLLQHEPFFKAVVRTTHAVLRTGNHVRDVVNLNDLVAHYSWINGVKTGHTLDAGYVLVASGTQGRDDADRRRARHLERGRARLQRAGAPQLGLRELRHAHARSTPARCSPGRRSTATPGRTCALVAASTYTHVFPRCGQGQAARQRAGAAHRPAGEGRAGRLGGGRRGRPGRDAHPAAARRRGAADQKAEIDR